MNEECLNVFFLIVVEKFRLIFLDMSPIMNKEVMRITLNKQGDVPDPKKVGAEYKAYLAQQEQEGNNDSFNNEDPTNEFSTPK
jgi:hypothetical protein